MEPYGCHTRFLTLSSGFSGYYENAHPPFYITIVTFLTLYLKVMWPQRSPVRISQDIYTKYQASSWPQLFVAQRNISMSRIYGCVQHCSPLYVGILCAFALQALASCRLVGLQINQVSICCRFPASIVNTAVKYHCLNSVTLTWQ